MAQPTTNKGSTQKQVPKRIQTRSSSVEKDTAIKQKKQESGNEEPDLNLPAVEEILLEDNEGEHPIIIPILNVETNAVNISEDEKVEDKINETPEVGKTIVGTPEPGKIEKETQTEQNEIEEIAMDLVTLLGAESANPTLPGELSLQLVKFSEAKAEIIHLISKEKSGLQLVKNQILKQLQVMDRQIVLMLVKLTANEAQLQLYKDMNQKTKENVTNVKISEKTSEPTTQNKEKVETKKTYAQIVKEAENTIVIEIDGETEEIEKTRQLLTLKTLTTVKPKDVLKTKKGIVIKCNNTEDREKIKSAIEKEQMDNVKTQA